MDEGRPPDPEASASPDPTEEVDPADVEPIEPRAPGRGIVAIVGVLVVALVVFAIVGGRIITAAPAQTTAQPPRLAVTDRDGKLHTMDASGGSVTDFGASGVQFGFPTWSPDGTRIAVTGKDKDSTAIYVFDAGTASAKPAIVYDSAAVPPFYAYWSPDGGHIAFLAQKPDKIALQVVPADGSAKVATVREGAPLYWDWLGSDHLVAHIGLAGSEGSFLGEVDLKGTSSETEPLTAGSFRSPAVSHDRAFRAYVTSGQQAAGMVTVESADRASRQTTEVFGVAAVSFDPAGQTLAFVGAKQPLANDPGFPLGPLKAIDPRNGQTRTLLDGDVVGFFWAPDGRTIAALTIAPVEDQPVGIVGPPGARLASARGPAPGAEPRSTAEGVPLTLAFVDVASGALRAQRPAEVTSTFVNNILPYFDQYALSHRMWAPDSSAIALPLVKDGSDQLFVIKPDGSEPVPLNGAQLGFWSP